METPNPTPTLTNTTAEPIDGYIIQELLAEGGFGRTFRAVQLLAKKSVALTLLPVEKTETAEQAADGMARLQQELRAVSEVRHANLTAVVDFGVCNGRPYLTTELLEGETLQSRVADKGNYRASTAASLVASLTEAITAAHTQGIVHGGLNPSRIVFTREGTPKITGLGLARFDRRPSASDRPSLFVPAPNPNYLAPEQAVGEPTGYRTDVHALGAILYALLVGRPPYLGRTAQHTLLLAANGEYTPLTSRRRDLPADLVAICHKCLSLDKRNRYASTIDLLADLRAFLAGQPVQARPWTRLERWAHAVRQPAFGWYLRVAAAAVMVLTVNNGLWYYWFRTSQPTPEQLLRAHREQFLQYQNSKSDRERELSVQVKVLQENLERTQDSLRDTQAVLQELSRTAATPLPKPPPPPPPALP